AVSQRPLADDALFSRAYRPASAIFRQDISDLAQLLAVDADGALAILDEFDGLRDIDVALQQELLTRALVVRSGEADHRRELVDLDRAVAPSLDAEHRDLPGRAIAAVALHRRQHLVVERLLGRRLPGLAREKPRAKGRCRRADRGAAPGAREGQGG